MNAPLKKNVLANLTGGAWTAVMGLVFMPLYVQYLGPEAYGLVALFGTVMAVFGIMDLGLATTLNRGLARLTSKPESAGEQRDLLRSIEVIYWGVAITIGLLTFAVAGPYATSWVNPEQLSRASVQSAVRLMGIVAALQFPFALYQAGLMGLQRQVLLNVVLIVCGTLRTVGAVLILAFVSPTIEAFFTWQAVVMAVQLAATIIASWRSIAAPTTPRFRNSLLRDHWRFAAGVSVNAIIGVFLTQSDKVLLSGLLPLADFGYYALAGNVAATLWRLIVPINAALFPRFTQLLELRDETRVRALYHTACQLVAALILPIAGTMAFFSRTLLLIWTRNPDTARKASVLVTLLVIGTTLNGLASVPSYFQSASGWPQLMMYTNLAGALILVPSIVPMVAWLGAPGAALVWLLLNLGYVLVTVPIMHRRLLKGEARRWYVEDVLMPVMAIVSVAAAARLAMPADLPLVAAFRYVALSFGAMAVAAFLALPRARALLLRMLERREEAIV
jgi:O-antigen/teichoic acid export membrane protein